MQCGELWLNSSLSGYPAPQYAAIVYNFGLHDTNIERKDEESRDEYVPIDEYGNNLVLIHNMIKRFQPQAQVGYLLTTPMHFDMLLNGLVQSYNTRAVKLLLNSTSEAPPLVNWTIDMYNVVTKVCGEPPYYGSKADPSSKHNCSLINDNEEYHYNTAGWELLATNVAGLLRKMVAARPTYRRTNSATTSTGGNLCADHETFCPSGTTCIADSWSNTKWGCCMVPDAVDCGDSWHCCMQGQKCMHNQTNGDHICA